MAPASVPPPEPPGSQFNFAQHLLAGCARHAGKPAFVDDAGSLSYRELDDRARRWGAGLLASGLRREERVLLLMHDGLDWPVAFLGALYAGIVPVAVNTLLTADDYAYMLEHSRAQAAVVSGALLPVLKAAMDRAKHELREVLVSRPQAPLGPGERAFAQCVADAAPAAEPAATAPDDAAFWLYSSGSTGRPKGTVHSHANPYWTAELYGKALLGIAEDDVCFSAAKLFFAYGLGNALTFPLAVGATVLLMAERPTPEAVFKRWRGEVGGLKPTVFFGAPTGYAGMLASPALPARDAVALRLASSAGEALPAELGERFRRHFGVDIVDGIGSTEMLHIFLSNRPGDVRYGTTGWPVPGYRVELRGDDGRPVPDGEPGDLFIQGPSAALMYWGNRAKTQDTFAGAWTKSGDKYLRNADGTYTYGGRSDDMLKVSGVYVSPFEVEATLVQHPAVLEAAVIGTPDAEGLTKTKAFVVLKADAEASEDELKTFVKERLAPFKYPRFVEFIDELPKTATGKIQRFKLREREAKKLTSAFVDVPWAGRTVRIEHAWIAPERRAAPLLVFLHEGLGSLAMWKGFPAQLCEAAGCRGLVYSRPGYGRSTPRTPGENWAPDFMHRQAQELLPALFHALNIDTDREPPWLFGHSDGGSIALLYAAAFPARLAGAVVLAPHIRVEPVSIASIRKAREAYREGGLREGLARYHDDPDSAFWGWNDIWLDPAFERWSIEAELGRIECPLLAMQGIDDEYGTLAHIRGIAREAPGTQLLELPGCGHSPHRDQPAAVIDAVSRFLQAEGA